MSVKKIRHNLVPDLKLYSMPRGDEGTASDSIAFMAHELLDKGIRIQHLDPHTVLSRKDGYRKPTFKQCCLNQLLTFFILISLPIIWVVIIFTCLLFILRKSSKANHTAGEFAAYLIFFNMLPFSITYENCQLFCGNRKRLNGVDEFRLLAISPGSFDSSVRGGLATASFSSNRRPAYGALSYPWADEIGDAERSVNFLCEENTGIIQITKNCEVAIRRLRLPNEKRWVWIDTICIDQSSEAERTYQVSMMSKIYMSARRVVVYTSERTAHTDNLFDWLNGLKTKDINFLSNWDLGCFTGDFEISMDRFWSVNKERLLKLSSGHRAYKQDIKLTSLAHIEPAKEYFSRRWFNRVWALQEFALPDVRNIDVICGTKSISAIRALHALFFIYQDSSGSMIRIFVLLRKKMKGLKKSHLLDILIETRDRQAGDPRDKIFGVLSIAHYLDEGKFLELKADYEISIPEIYANYSAFFIQHHGPGFFLSLIKYPSRISQLPSWVADWSVSWPNYNAVGGRDFAAASGPSIDMDSGVSFRKENGCHVLTLIRSRIIQGYFTRNGHINGVNDTTMESLEDLRESEVLIEIYPGVAALLNKEDEYYIFTQVCLHTLSESGVEELVGRWGSVVIDAKGPKDQMGLEGKFSKHLSLVETFNIR
ncbi:heterokaryon incompatibility protein-domain-containing protein [Halenospora varia]|nr:heterokaryon incompatibility protein-domain-containing protein [Halenospora varia]